MIKIAVSGCNGAMGRNVVRAVQNSGDCEVVAGFDIRSDGTEGFPVFADPSEFTGGCDAVIDFSHPSSLTALLRYCTERKVPVVVATTGITEEQKDEMKRAGAHTAVFYSANMSIGINLLLDLVRRAASALSGNFDIEIIEKHHNQKVDAPSGTALRIAEAVQEAIDFDAELVYDRHEVRHKRDPYEIGMHAIRGGTIVGEHEVLFCGKDEIFSISHEAHSKEIFAVGALKAARFLLTKDPGFYDMSDMIQEA